ncbi:MAG TPA: ABC transporter permease [Blastocatellia bacterium]|jgi:putative ABC transport system permease protein|nr:ABC transporter permease [Blastocatellia bacterium]
MKDFLKPHLRLIRFIGVIVPRRFRARFRQEWEAELEYREEMLARWDRLDWRNKLELLWRSLGAFWDALWLQRQRWEDEMIQDLRFGVRMLLKNPGFTLIAVITLALGIGANTVIFSVVNAVLLRQLPYADPERLVVLWERQRDVGQESPSYPNFLDWQSQNRSFEQMAMARFDSVTLVGAGEPERLICRQVSANFFSTLGAQPRLGRAFTAEEDRAGANPVVIISHSLWQRRFGADAEIIGKTLTLSNRQFTVIGVLPPDFQFYFPTDVFVSINMTIPERLKQERAEHGGITAVARLKPGVTREQASAEMENIAVNLERQYPKTNTTNRVFLRSIREDQVGSLKSSLLLLFGAVAFVLLIACANVANLLLARAAARRKEIAIRAALGASRARVLRQLLTESLLLAASGGALGLLLAAWGKGLLVAQIANNLPWIKELPIDGAVLLFAAATSLLTGLVFGLFPALRSARMKLTEALNEGARGAGGARQPMRGGLVVAEVALALLLLMGAGLMLRSFALLNRIDTGFKPQNLLTMTTMLSPTRYDAAAKVRWFYDELQRRIQPLPGVQAVAFSNRVPLQGFNVTTVVLEGQSYNGDSGGYLSVNSIVSPDYFRTLGVTLLKGRLLTARDTTNSGGIVAVIDENMSRDLFPGKDPLGQAMFLDEGKIRVQIVGVVNHIRHQSYDAEEQSKVRYQFYTSLAQFPDQYVPQLMRNLNLIVRAEHDPANLIAAIRAQVFEMDREQLVDNAMTMDQIIAGTISQRRLLMFLLVLFAVIALTLAVIGIYGVISYAVSQRTREIGVRLALGARTGDVLKLVIGRGMNLALGGVALGLVAAFALTRLLAEMLYGVSPTDPAAFVAVPIILTGVALAACYLPARRATKVDPMVAIRHE